MAYTNDQQLELLASGQSDWDTSLNANAAILARGMHVVQVAGSAINSGQVCVVGSGGTVLPMNANSTSNFPALMAVTGVNSGEFKQFLATGVVRSMTVWSGAIVPGEKVYVSTASLGFPVSSYNSVSSVTLIGVALDWTSILFRPRWL
jgi:hypothetical protein